MNEQEIQFHIAAVQGNLSLVQSYLKDKNVINVDCTDEDGTTVLILAAANNHLPIVKEVLMCGASVNARRKIIDIDIGYIDTNQAPLVPSESQPLFKEPQYESVPGLTAEKQYQNIFLECLKCCSKSSGHKNISVFSLAKMLRLLTSLFKMQIKLTIINCLTGTTALFFAAQGGYLKVVEELLNNGAEIDLPSNEGGTPLFVASQCNHLDVVKELVKRSANIHAQMKDGATPLFVACQNGHINVVKHLLQKGAHVDHQRFDLASPLWIASQEGHVAVVKELLAANATVDLHRQDGGTPLFKAAHKGHCDVVELLIKNGASLELLKNGETALHAAALFGQINVVKKLVESGADPHVQNKDGFIPLDLAKDANFDEIVSYLSTARKSYSTAV